MQSIDDQLTDPAWFATHDPHEIWRVMRASDPIHWTEGTLPFGFWSLTRYEDMLAVLRDAATFSSQREGNVLPTSVEINTLERASAGFGEMVVSTDPPRHNPLRRSFTKPFLRSSIKRFEDRARELAREIVDEVAPLGQCDFVDDIAVKMPIRFICDLMGMPREDWEQVLAWGNMSANPEDPEYQHGRGPLETRLAAFRELYVYCLRIAGARRPNPGADVLSAMATATMDGAPLPDRLIGLNGVLLIGAGFETTRNALSGGVAELIRNPDQWERLRSDPALIATAVEEILRWTCPLTNALRTATRDTSIRGCSIREGERVVLWLPSGNRDEAIFPNAHRFDVGRTPNEHLSFGYGEHFCLGAHLARLELRSMLEEIVPRMPDMELNGATERICSNQLAGIKHMPVRFTPSRANT